MIDEEDDTFFYTMETSSATECTGIAPTVPENEAECESVGELYSIHKPKD